MEIDNVKENVYLCICDKNNVITICNYKLFNSFIEANNYYKKNIIILIIIIYQQ
jgi:hypothetical protein